MIRLLVEADKETQPDWIGLGFLIYVFARYHQINPKCVKSKHSSNVKIKVSLKPLF